MYDNILTTNNSERQSCLLQVANADNLFAKYVHTYMTAYIYVHT